MNLMDLAVINEPIAISTLPLRQQDFLEAEKAIGGKAAAVIYTAAATFFVILIGLYGISAQFSVSYIPAVLLFIPGIGLPASSLLYFFMPQWIGDWGYHQYEKNDPQQIISFYQDHFEISGMDSISEICLYADIGRIVMSENLYIIIFPDLMYIPIRYAAITEENWTRISHCISMAKNSSWKEL